jgi:hypothetical protein
MKISQAIFTANAHIAFIQLSGSNQLLENCWAEQGERVMIVGLRQREHAALDALIAAHSLSGVVQSEACLGLNVVAVSKSIVSDEVSKLKVLLAELEDKGIVTKVEKDKAISELGLRSFSFHPFLSDKHAEQLDAGAGI